MRKKGSALRRTSRVKANLKLTCYSLLRKSDHSVLKMHRMHRRLSKWGPERIPVLSTATDQQDQSSTEIALHFTPQRASAHKCNYEHSVERLYPAHATAEISIFAHTRLAHKHAD